MFIFIFFDFSISSERLPSAKSKIIWDEFSIGSLKKSIAFNILGWSNVHKILTSFKSNWLTSLSAYSKLFLVTLYTVP